jgi:hypothetical protein
MITGESDRCTTPRAGTVITIGELEYDQVLLMGCHEETFKCLSSIGWIFTIFCTYIGFAILMFATMWNADLIGKLAAMREKWRELRAQ